jgi:hypothetical protein
LPKVVFLVGLPGSGKSTFASALTAADGDTGTGWVRVCQDEAGCRGAAEEEFRRALKGKVPGGRAGSDNGAKQQQQQQRGGLRVILDRCNVTATERQEWLGMVGPTGEDRLDMVVPLSWFYGSFHCRVCEREYCTTFLSLCGQHRPLGIMHPPFSVHVFCACSLPVYERDYCTAVRPNRHVHYQYGPYPLFWYKHVSTGIHCSEAAIAMLLLKHYSVF